MEIENSENLSVGSGSIPVIDIFAGPGGLGEGFSGAVSPEGKRVFEIALSIEKEYFAHKTLTLRSFFRQFEPGKVPDEYYRFVQGLISEEELYNSFPLEAELAKKEAWHAELGENETAVPNSLVDKRIREALGESRNWLLIGGPPCQAYSVVGRSRRREKILDEVKDERVGLYKQYLRILAVHNPTVFVMENVKGLLSARTEENSVFNRILNDLTDPVKAFRLGYSQDVKSLECPGYRIYSLIKRPLGLDIEENPIFDPKDFVIKAEDYGIPQTRHRVILLGIRKDIPFEPDILSPQPEVPISQVLSDLPSLRSGLSKRIDTDKNWLEVVRQVSEYGWLKEVNPDIVEEVQHRLHNIRVPKDSVGSDYVVSENESCKYRKDWFVDERLGGALNHSSRAHMDSDLWRYLFVSAFGKVKAVSPKLDDFPEALLPAHQNVKENKGKRKFADRFRVQLWEEPSKTITSHISKDGHYYIHPDPSQCRSFTVREAARIQTFPDNYYFCGHRTAQFQQVGNAVPPLLANKIAVIVNKLFENLRVVSYNLTGSLEKA
jgi:DNA (cytosine-5)-methyltransferase 1